MVISNPAASTVLCFGDSNTNGIPSDDANYVRLPADVRWTGRLQLLLGDGYDVIEEGLRPAACFSPTRPPSRVSGSR
jgi:lysophospholipase L1-like esterase